MAQIAHHGLGDAQGPGVMQQLAREGMTMLVVTHEISFARDVSNKVVFMEHGVVVEAESSKDFFEHPRQPRSREFIQNVLNRAQGA